MILIYCIGIILSIFLIFFINYINEEKQDFINSLQEFGFFILINLLWPAFWLFVIVLISGILDYVKIWLKYKRIKYLVDSYSFEIHECLEINDFERLESSELIYYLKEFQMNSKVPIIFIVKTNLGDNLKIKFKKNETPRVRLCRPNRPSSL